LLKDRGIIGQFNDRCLSAAMTSLYQIGKSCITVLAGTTFATAGIYHDRLVSYCKENDKYFDPDALERGAKASIIYGSLVALHETTICLCASDRIGRLLNNTLLYLI